MRTLIQFLLLCFLVSLTGSVFAADAVDFSQLLGSVKTMRADFTQTIYDNRGKRIQQSRGHMEMQRPGKFRWEVLKPIPQLIIANQLRLWIYDPDLEQVTIRSLRHATGDAPALLLTHVNTVLDKDFAITEMKKKSQGLRWYQLTPKGRDSMFAAIEMGFANNEMKEMHLQDHLGHMTVIEFKNIHTNITIPSSIFVFHASSKVDVINETRKNKAE